MNAWVLIFCLKLLEIVFSSFPISNIFLGGGGGMPPHLPRGQWAFGPFYQLRWVLTKGRQLLQILQKALLPLLQPPFVGHIHQANTNVVVSACILS